MSMSRAAVVLLGMLVLVSADHHHGPPGPPAPPGMMDGGHGDGGEQDGDGDGDKPIIDYGGIKPGTCPVEEGGFSICGGTPCRGDEDCPGTDKCCQRSCGKLCMAVPREVTPMDPGVGEGPAEVMEHPGVCPTEVGGRAMCTGTTCTNDGDCAGYEKCCFDFECGTESRCMPAPQIQPVRVGPLGPKPPIGPTTRSGVCPEELGATPYCGGALCIHDGECGPGEKCCSASACGEGLRCMPAPQIQPLPPTQPDIKKLCPLIAPTELGNCDGQECLVDADCFDNEKCCGSACGYHCTMAVVILPTLPELHLGQCPSVEAAGACENAECVHDGDCAMIEKCCGSTCGFHCTPAVPIDPVFNPECPGDLVNLECNSACPDFCGRSPEAPLCMQMCEPGCGCPSGTIRQSENSSVCVTEENCPVDGGMDGGMEGGIGQGGMDGGMEGGMDQGGQRGARQCSGDLEFNDCAVTCELTCAEPNPRPCIKLCGIGCYCPHGMIRESLESDRCYDNILSCPQIAVDTRPCETERRMKMEESNGKEGIFIPQCTQDGYYAMEQCYEGNGSYCWCADPQTGVVIPDSEVHGARANCERLLPDPSILNQCPEGKVFADGVKKCVYPEPEPEPRTPECPGDLVHLECNSACPDFCGRSPEAALCMQMCEPGCGCPSGTIRVSEKSNACVAEDECPVKGDCPGDFVQNECNSACPAYCGQPEDVVCIKLCVIGCGCPRGTVMESENSNVCIAEENCPVPEPEAEPPTPECPGDLVYLECNSACPDFCGKSLEVAVCMQMCEPGCGCPSGTIRQSETSNVCVAPHECPAPTCVGDLEYQNCGTACPNMCNEPQAQFCTFQCVLECQCPSNMYRVGGTSRCVAQDTCPPPCDEGYKHNEQLECVVANPCPEVLAAAMEDGLLIGEFSPTCTNEGKYEEVQCSGSTGFCWCVDTETGVKKQGTDVRGRPDCSAAVPTCEGDLEYQTCGSNCPPVCNQPPVQACNFACMVGCQCPPGKYLVPDVTPPRCVAFEDCPTPVCDNGGTFQICGRECADYCGKPANEPCISLCIPGCMCPEGTVLVDRDTDVCVPVADCPVPVVPEIPVELAVRTNAGFQCPPKRGRCPYRLAEETVDTCTEECQDDYDCSGERKCCSRGCSSICVFPNFPVPQPYPEMFPPEPTSPPAAGIAVDSCPAQDAAMASCGASCLVDTDCASGEMCCTNDACDGSVCLPARTEMMCTTVPCPMMEAGAPSDMEQKVCGSVFIFIVKIRSDGRAKILDDLKYYNNPYANPKERPIVKLITDDVCNVELTEERYILFMDGNAANVDAKKLTLDQTVMVIPLTGHLKNMVNLLKSACPMA